MKKTILVILVIFVIVLAGFLPIGIKHFKSNKKVVVEQQDDFLKIPDYDSDEGIKTVASPPKPIDTGDVSYWFVVVETGDTKYNTMMQQNHKGFSMSEAKAEFKNKKVFIVNFIQVSKETWDINNQ